MADIKWLEGNRIQIAPPKRTKKSQVLASLLSSV